MFYCISAEVESRAASVNDAITTASRDVTSFAEQQSQWEQDQLDTIQQFLSVRCESLLFTPFLCVLPFSSP